MRKLIFSATLLLALSQLASRALGVWRDHVFANTFGATGGAGIFQLDAYFTAFRLPDLVYSLLVFGTLSAAFVPLLAKQKSRADANQFASNTLNVLFISVLALAVIVFVFATPLTKIIAPGFDAEATALTAKLLRIQLLAPLFFTISAVAGGLAQHFHRFAWFALAPVFYNLGIIFGALVWGSEFGVVGLSWGVALGAGLHALIQLPGVLANGFRWQPIFRPARLWQLFSLAGPRVLAVATMQLQFVVITIFATLAGAGKLAVFNYAWNLAALPLGVVGLAFATTSFAGLSRLADNAAAFREKLRANFAGVLFWVMPAAVGLFVLRIEIVRLILAGGAFVEADIILVSRSVAVLAFAVPAISLWPLLQNAFFARRNTRTPLVAGIVALAITTLVAWLLVESDFVTALAAAYAIAAICGVGILFWQLPNDLRGVPKNLGKITLVALALGGIIFGFAEVWPATTFWSLAAKVGGLTLLGGSFYLAATKRLGIESRNFW